MSSYIIELRSITPFFFLCLVTRITLYNVCAVPWGVISTVGVFSTVGGYHEYRGGYLEYRGGYLEYRGGCSVPCTHYTG